MTTRILQHHSVAQKNILFLYGIVFLLVNTLCLARAENDSDLLTRLVRNPLIGAVTLSSDGHFLAALARQHDGDSKIAVWSVNAGFEAADVLPYVRADVGWMGWVGGGRLLLSLSENGLVIYDAHIGRLRPLIDSDGPRPDELPPILISDMPDDPVHVLLQWEDPGTPGFPAVYRVNILDGTSEKIISGWNPVIRWWASPSGEVQMGEGFKGRRQLLYARRSDDGSWYTVSDRDYFDGPALSVLMIEPGGATALVLSAHAGDKRDLWRMDIKTGDMLTRLAAHPQFDMSAALIDPVTDLTIGASYVAEGDVNIVWLAERKQELQSFERQLGTNDLRIVSASRDGRRVLLRSDETYRPPVYTIFDREEKSFTRLPFDAGIETLPKPVSSGVYMPVKGMKAPMHAILSVPQSGLTGKAVVLVHGGPVSRAATQFQPLVSWLVAHGYSVLQPNFRGSSGYGETWRRAGYGEWGRRMQEDVRTAAEWLVDQGISSAGQMCVMGGSFGGYAALLSSIRDDDLFACAISLNGVSSLPYLIDFLNKNRFHMLTIPRIKEHLSERVLMRRSPLNRVDLVRTPVLLLHATHDTNVPFYHSTLMADALADHSKEYEFIVLKGAEHVLYNEADKRTYLSASLQFLDKYLKQRPLH
ncbi:alpha/beta hydrolase family protein [Kordiimonas pumila]|uniref:Alpha/beta hydrolase family protein n=1 Tax=Kordiimonas pumila TaxID=2161677 RepID=A0ABV7D742_9PROT|nr:prolyl oligopeptidase family serine peptidase [Kordiimonas pumila]